MVDLIDKGASFIRTGSLFWCQTLLCIFLFVGWGSIPVSAKLNKYACDINKTRATIEPTAQAFLIGMFAFHERGDANSGCGPIRAESMQSYEAIRWALDLINKKGEFLNGQFLKDSYVPGIQIGMLARDYCNQKPLAIAALQNAVDELNGMSCQSGLPVGGEKMLLGVIGASTDDATMALADQTTTDRLPLISYISTSPKLSDSQKYPYVMRTIPSDKALLGLLVEVLQKLNWNFVTVVYTDDVGGMDSYMELRERVMGKGVCLTAGIAMSSTDTSDGTMKEVLGQIKAKGTTGVIYLGTGNVLQSLFKTADTYPGAGSLQWIVTSSLSLSNTFPNNKYPRGVVAVLTGSRFIVGFEDHWKRIDENSPSSENPWFQEWYMESKKCKLPGVTQAPYVSYPPCPKLSDSDKSKQFVQDQSVESAVHAVFTYARALRMAQADKCGSTPGLCTALADLSTTDFAKNYLKKVKFTYQTSERIPSFASSVYAPYKKAKELNFDLNGDIINPEFGIWNFNSLPTSTGYKFRNIGTYSNGQLSLELSKLIMYSPDRSTKLSPLPSSTCGQPKCKPCLNSYSNRKYMYKAGDILVSGFFSIHNAGITPFSCGDFNTKQSQVQLLEAMSFAVGNIKTKYPNLLPGVKVGLLGLDDCSMSSTAVSLISEVKQGHMKIIDPGTGIPLLPWTMSAYMGLANNQLTAPVAKAMNTWTRPLIGYVPAGEELTQREKYPYYLYTLPPVSKLMYVVSKTLKELGWLYVQVIYSDDHFGQDGLNQLREQAAKFGICVVANYKFNSTTPSIDLINKLRRTPKVKPTVLILPHEQDIHKLMMGIKSLAAGGEFTFIGLDSWGTSEQIAKSFKTDAQGVLTIKHQAPTLVEFIRHLKSLDINTNKLNPWLGEWFQSLYHCAIDSTNSASYSTICNATVKASEVTEAANFRLDPRALSVINGVYAFAHGLHATLVAMCGSSYSGVCSEFFTSRMTGKTLVDKMESVSFLDETGNTFTFNKDGYGNVDYEIYNYNGGKYEKVGGYSSAKGTYQLISSKIRLFSGSPVSSIKPTCPDQCISCQYLLNEKPVLFVPGDLMLPVVFDIHYKGNSPFVCGDIRLHGGFQDAEAVLFALDWINSGKFSYLKAHNVSLGSLGFDGCQTPAQAESLTFSLQYGLFDAKRLGLESLPASKLQGWLAYDSGSTMKMLSVLQPLQMPLVSPGATSPVLSDKSRFSTLFRTIQSDTEVVEAMAKLVKQLGFSYIITLNRPDAGSRDSLALFRRLVEGMGVCIADSFEFGTDGTAENIIFDITKSSSRVVVVFGDYGKDIKNLLAAKQKLPAGKDIVFISNRAWSLPRNMPYSVIEKSVMFQKDFPLVNEFKQWLNQRTPNTLGKTNPWFDEYFEKFYGCSMGLDCSQSMSVVSGRFVQDVTVVPTIDAVFAYAMGLQMTLEEKCGASYSGVCDKFWADQDTRQRLMANMDLMKLMAVYKKEFKFVDRERPGKIMVKRILNGTMDYIADYTNSALNYYGNMDDVIRYYERVPSKCYTACAKCEKKETNEEKFIFTPGDFILVGLFDVHKQGATPYSCGSINDKQGYQLVEAFNYAINYINSNQGIFNQILRGVSLGGLALDVCQSPLRAANLVTNVYNRKVQIFSNITNTRIDPGDLQVFIGPFDSESSLRVAEVLSKLGVPQISYGATSVELRNDKHPFFLRTVPADDKQARAMISYLKRFNITHVQMLNTNETVGRNGREEFAKLAFLNKICVVQNISLTRAEALTGNEATAGVGKLLKFPDSNAVIVFTADPRPILLAAEKNAQVAGKFLFLVTDKWGGDIDMLNGLDKLLAYRRVVIFDMETADLPGYDIYLDKKTPVSNVNSPWFNEYYQHLYDCGLYGPTTQYPRECKGISYRSLPRASSYIQDPYVLYVVNSVFSAAIGIHKALESVCGQNYRGLCLEFLNGDQKQKILKGIKEAEFLDATQQKFFFLKNTFESDRGYHIYEPVIDTQISTLKYIYENVGSYNDTHFLKIDARYDQNWPTSCQNQLICPKCYFPPYQPSRFTAKPSPFYLNIVAILDIHQADPKDPKKCGPIDWESNFQHLLAFFYAIQNVNKNYLFKLSNSLQLGGVAIDTCSNPSRIGQDVYSLLTGDGLCGIGGSDKMVIPPATIVSFLPKDSSNSLTVAEILTPYNLTSISQSATSVKLSNKDIYPYFLRTVPPDNIQSRLIAELLNKMQWTYVSFVYSDNVYGRSSYEEFIKEAHKDNARLCLAYARSMPLTADIVEARKIVGELNRKAGARVVVLFVNTAQIRLLLQAAKDLKLSRRFIWLGSDTWANSGAVVSNGLEEVASGAITIKIQSMPLEGFFQYVQSLSLAQHDPIPDDWFEEFYQDIHQCRILRSVVQKNYNRLCTGNEVITESMLPKDPFVFQTILAVDMIALGLNNIEKCREGNTLSVAACLALQPERNRMIYESILKSQWSQLHLNGTSIPGDFTFRFTNLGYGDIGYDILNYRYDVNTNKYEYVQIGTWGDEFKLDVTKYRGISSSNEFVLPHSQCTAGGTCTCLDTKGNAVDYQQSGQMSRLISGNRLIMIDPKTGAVIDLNNKQGADYRFSQIWGTICTTLAALGAFFALCLFCYFIIFYPFRGNTTILGFTLLVAIIFLYLMVIAFVAHANPVVCSIRRFFLGFFYCLAYSALFVKLLDAYRNKNKEELVYRKLARPCGLLMSCFLLVGVQSIINIEWLILIPPEMVEVPYEGVMWPRCAPDETSDMSLIMSLIFVMCILLLCVAFGLCTWSSKNNCYEARWILGMAVLSILVWIVWCLVAVVGSYRVRDIAVAVGLLINATILLVLGPIRRLRLLKEYKEKIKNEKDEYYLYDHDMNNSLDYSQAYNAPPQLRTTGSEHY